MWRASLAPAPRSTAAGERYTTGDATVHIGTPAPPSTPDARRRHDQGYRLPHKTNRAHTAWSTSRRLRDLKREPALRIDHGVLRLHVTGHSQLGLIAPFALDDEFARHALGHAAQLLFDLIVEPVVFLRDRLQFLASIQIRFQFRIVQDRRALVDQRRITRAAVKPAALTLGRILDIIRQRAGVAMIERSLGPRQEVL